MASMVRHAWVNLQVEALSSFEYYGQVIIYSVIGFMVPLLLGHPQLLVGVVVNAALVLGALYLDGRGVLPIILLPSLGVLSRGMIFGPFTVFLVYMIPFIWVGNSILVFSMKYLYLKRRMMYGVSLGVSALAKTLFLFGCAFALVKLGVLPPVFLTTMGTLQLATAAGGGALSWSVVKARALVKK
ncbi:hypothetical protein COY95_05085 [Candidatus Woesearchaeota archaeon CG_4_10_14_0_8_um_filter_47_5]|nr:MAG: hypothetical protein COY95_05085 [Candidatus Woesearchaeota archaeon CG_4_10_14_0_8_um_filter_47_5]